jgi:carboxypeptidase D
LFLILILLLCDLEVTSLRKKIMVLRVSVVLSLFLVGLVAGSWLRFVDADPALVDPSLRGFIGFDESLIRISNPTAEVLAALQRIEAVVDNGRTLPQYIDIYGPPHIRAALNQLAIPFEVLSTEERDQQRQTRLLERRASAPAIAYHDYTQLTTFLFQANSTYPDITHLYSIGQSVQGRELWVLDISDNPTVNEPNEPEFKYIGNMHGDETVGRECLVQFITLLLSSYRQNSQITTLIDNTHISIMVTMNPDGFELARRANAHGIDLNRNFPDQFQGSPAIFEPETAAVMAWSLSRNFMLSANLHGGDLVANYPWDGNRQEITGLYAGAPDDATFRQMALCYSMAHTTMHLSRIFPNGITNGAMWYVLYGGMQDWNYLHTNDMEITLELSFDKYPAPATLSNYWSQNKPALLALLQESNRGIHGTVLDAARQPISGATVTVVSPPIDHALITDEFGQYYRYLTPGDYRLAIAASGYVTATITVTLTPTAPLTITTILQQA